MQLYFPGSTFSSISANTAAFASVLLNAAIASAGPVTYGNITVQLNQTSTGAISATIYLPALSQQTTLVTVISSGTFGFSYNAVKYTGSFSATYGVCTQGSVSSTSYAPGCFTCPANTYV